MDALQRPLRIPPGFSSYAEENGVFELYSKMLGELIVNKPSDPLQFLADYLSRPKDDVSRIIVYGPPCSGQHTVSKLTARRMKSIHIQPQRVLEEDKTGAGKRARSLQQEGKEIPDSLWAELIHSRLSQKDCVDKGFVLEGFPRTRGQALALQSKGILAKHFVHLETNDSVLLERYSGKRIDSLTGDVYHLVFNPPKSDEVASRLIQEPGGVEENMHSKLTHYHRHSQALLSCYNSVCKTFNVDQPINDIFSQVYSFLCSVPRSAAPHTPRVVLIGPTGSGKSLQATQLARKYHLVDVDVRQLIRQTLVSGSKLADQMSPFYERKMLIPDDMVMTIVSKRLSQLDCSSRGWVIHGFPLSRDQAELLTKSGHKPNRVFFFNISEDSVKERLTLRHTDPITGERYHQLFKPPATQDIKERLQIHHRDTEFEVMKRVSLYNNNVEDLADYYTWCQYINADQDPGTVFECLESMLVNPLPQQHTEHINNA